MIAIHIVLFTASLLAAVLVSAPPQEKTLRIWTARALATVLAEAGSEFERTSGFRLRVTSDLPTGFERLLSTGEQPDIVITNAVVIDQWIAAGRLAADTRSDIARSAIGVAVRTGAAKPDLSSVDAFRRALLGATSVGFLKVGSGLHVEKVIERLGITDVINAKAVRPDADIVSELVAKGQVQLGIVVSTQILTTPGVELAGPLPPELQSYLTFSAAVSPASKAPDIGRQLIAFLRGPSVRRVIERQGMEALGDR